MRNRKIIQICATEDATDDPIPSLYALCDDGSVWRIVLFDDKEWERVDTSKIEKTK